VAGAGAQHDKPVEAERDAGAVRQAVFERGEEILVDRIGFAVERLFARLVGREAGALFLGVGQFLEGVGELEAADIELEALRETRIARLAAR
jgi:hypothetical protein